MLCINEKAAWLNYKNNTYLKIGIQEYEFNDTATYIFKCIQSGKTDPNSIIESVIDYYKPENKEEAVRDTIYCLNSMKYCKIIKDDKLFGNYKRFGPKSVRCLIKSGNKSWFFL